MQDQDDPSKEVIALIVAGRKIEAIKLVREQNNLGLKAAKDFVESYIARHPERFPSQNARGGSNNYIIWALAIIAVMLTIQFFA